ncbi:MAG: DUF4350 domain-containing protein [Cypionkella sp.]
MKGAFNPRTVLGLLVFGALAFLAMLWFIGQGDTGDRGQGSEAHASARGLVGYAALAALLERQGHTVSLSRSEGRLDEPDTLLVLTPTVWTKPEDIAAIVAARRQLGPTLVILPKWIATELPPGTEKAEPGWVALTGPMKPPFATQNGATLSMPVAIEALKRAGPDWRGLGLAGELPTAKSVMALEGGPWVGLVRDSAGRDLVAFADDRGCYRALETAAGVPPLGDDECEQKWAVTAVFEPDLVNNWGLADRARARLAARIVELASEEQNFPIVFDMTLAGFGGQRNLLTLAFEPPFLAATLCLMLALAVIGWRAFGRFGPPLAEAREIGFGKSQLAANAAGFVRRSGRLHLLARPYAALVGRRLAAALGLRTAEPQAIDAALARRAPESPVFSALAARLERARRPSDLLRAAHALHDLERILHR